MPWLSKYCLYVVDRRTSCPFYTQKNICYGLACRCHQDGSGTSRTSAGYPLKVVLSHAFPCLPDRYERKYCGHRLGRWGSTLMHPVGGHDATSHRTRRVAPAPLSGRLIADSRGDFPVPVPDVHLLASLIRCDASCVRDLRVLLKSSGYPPPVVDQLHSTRLSLPVSPSQSCSHRSAKSTTPR